MTETLEQKIAFLSQPSSYPDKTTAVDVVETHMSWVFLTDAFAYKLKKPVVYDHLDFSSLKARWQNCEEEVRLNRRLAANVYLEVLPLVKNAGGQLELAGVGVIEEWLVKMRRLPAHLALDACIRQRNIPEQAFVRMAEKLGRFYLGCQPEKMQPREYRERYARNIINAIADLVPAQQMIPMDIVQAIFRKLHAFQRENVEMLDRRVLDGKIVEGHGDLRAEHVYLETEPMIVDCLEFSRELRTVDAISDMAFLALDCERLGALQEGRQLLRRYSVVTGDEPSADLIHFYQTYHALSRARLALRHLEEARYQNDPKWPEQAKEWLRLAVTHAGKIGKAN